jgi:hypothetical protein
LIHNVNKHGHYWQQIVSMYLPGRTSLAAKNRYHILQRRLKSESEGAVNRVSALNGPMEASSWEDMLCFETTESSAWDTSSSATPKESALLGAQDSAWLALTSQSPVYDHPMQFDLEPTSHPFPRVGKFNEPTLQIVHYI